MIIITTQCFHPQIGGIEALMSGMAEGMAKTGKDILVLADGPINETDNLQNYKIKRFNAWKPIRRTSKARYIKNICKDGGIEAIYADSWKSIEYLKLVDVPIHVLAHGTEIQKDFSSWNFYKQNKQIRIHSSYKNSSTIAANSNYTKELLIESLSIDKNKIKVIHPGIDVYDKFIQKSTSIKIKNIIGTSSPVIITLARLETRKGHKIVLDALSALKSKYPKFLYLIAGDGPNKLEIKNHVNKLNLQSNVLFLGWITEPEKSVILKNSHLFVMAPHLDKESVEGFGMVFIDAAFHGLATLGTNTGGISDAIIDGKTGLIAKASDLKDLISKIDDLLSNDKKRNSLGKAGKVNATEKFTWERKVEEYFSLIKNV